MKILFVAFIGLFIMAVVVWFFIASELSDNQLVVKVQTAPRPKTFSTPREVPPLASNEGSTVPPPMPVPDGPEHDDRVHDRVTELLTLAMNDDAASLRTIWSELSNPDKEVRTGALEAVVQFGDRTVVPQLRKLAEMTDDSEEKARIAAAADQLELPPLVELLPSATNNAPATR